MPNTPIDSAVEREFDSEDQTKLSDNEHKRFMDPSKKIAHALISVSLDGKLVATQYAAPGGNTSDTPEIIPIHNIHLVEKYGAMRATAVAPDGTEMISKRFVEVDTEVNGAQAKHQLLFFSPKASYAMKGTGDVFWGSNELVQPAFFRSNLSKNDQKALKAEIKEVVPEIRGGAIDVVHKDVPVREQMKRTPDQNKVMKGSAIDAYEQFGSTYASELTPEVKQTIKKSTDARKNMFGLKSQTRPEWLHALGHSLVPLHLEPQTSANLGAAPKWMNTKMMTTERLLKWHAINRPNSKLQVKTHFNMLHDSDLVKNGRIEGSVHEKGKKVTIAQDLNPWAKHPTYPKPTDICQTTMVAHYMLTDKQVLSQQPVAIEKKMRVREGIVKHIDINQQLTLKELPKDLASIHGGNTNSSNSSSSSSSNNSNSNKSKGESSMKDGFTAQNESMHSSNRASRQSSRAYNPTTHPYEKSVVQIMSSFQEVDYETPWSANREGSCTGSGFVIERDNKHYILTNAHVVENSKFLEVRLANDNTLYEAKCLLVGYQADMALLEVSDPAFTNKTVPVKLGDMVSTQQKVSVVGFPMGGTEISTTKGIVSRIQVDDYSLSGERDLQAQTDSAINPGNSGGPVFSDNKVVGIAFQGITGASNLAYFIPMPVVKHFLIDAFSSVPYKGFPDLEFMMQPLDNALLRQSLGLKENQTGVRIMQVDPLSEAYGKLFKGDVLLAVDGLNVSNNCMVNMPGIGNRIDLNYLFRSKQIGESVHMTISRKNPATNQFEVKEMDIMLRWRPGQTKKVPPPEFNRQPTYYFNSGVCFQPLTHNFLETGRGHALREAIFPGVGYVSDVPKKKEDEQLVFINTILKSQHTKGYDFNDNIFVDKINGQAINNMADVIKVMEGHKGLAHEIEVSDGTSIVIKNLDKNEHKALLGRYNIRTDRSDDLKALKQGNVAAGWMPEVAAMSSSSSSSASSSAAAASWTPFYTSSSSSSSSGPGLKLLGLPAALGFPAAKMAGIAVETGAEPEPDDAESIGSRDSDRSGSDDEMTDADRAFVAPESDFGRSAHGIGMPEISVRSTKAPSRAQAKLFDKFDEMEKRFSGKRKSRVIESDDDIDADVQSDCEQEERKFKRLKKHR